MLDEPFIDAIDNVLPQTQCGLCGYDGCRPYAKAIALNQESINKCPPGGLQTLQELAEITHQDMTPFVEEMKTKVKPPSRAVIREAECIGCTKCIQVCPVDAILGAPKLMHTILAKECTGCELCIAPCPVDCIEMVPISHSTDSIKKEKSNLARQRYLARKERLSNTSPPQKVSETKPKDEAKSFTKAAIQEAVERVKARKSALNEC